jgi:hypothetical protein
MLAALAEHGEVKAESARRDRRVPLQLAYGVALMSARGYGAQETVKAFDRARELSAGIGGSVDRSRCSTGRGSVPSRPKASRRATKRRRRCSRRRGKRGTAAP